MNQMKTEPEHPRLEIGEEVEDFEKILKTSSGQLALVDAAVLRDIENPAVNDAIIFSTKQTPSEERSFKVTGTYDDATLRELKMEPATVEDESLVSSQEKEEKEEKEEEEEKVDEDIQVRGHDRTGGALGGTVSKKISRIERIAVGNSGSRQNRNKQDSTTKRKPVNPVKKMKTKMAQKVGMKGAERDNYGQQQAKLHPEKEKVKERPKNVTKEVNECQLFLKHVVNKTITEEFLNNMKYQSEIRNSMFDLRRKIINNEINNVNLDVVHDACLVLDEWLNESAQERTELIENLLKEGLPLV